MLGALKRILGIGPTSHPGTSTKASLFSGSAYFSNHVPTAFIEKWVTHGGRVLPGTSLDVRPLYFFATHPSEPWVTKLFAKSVVVIHAGWIVHCVDQGFLAPISEYILDDRFIPRSPYKLTNVALPTYVPLTEPGGSTDSEPGESGPTPVQASDTPSTPTNMRRKRKREQAYFDSPSGSLVFSGFDKDGMPRRPRKLRKLRFDPSFSPEGGRSKARKKAVRGTSPDWLVNQRDTWRDNDESDKEHTQDPEAIILRGQSPITTIRLPHTPDKSPVYPKPFATYRCPSVDKHLSKSPLVCLSADTVDTREKILPIRTIDFTNLPPPTRRWRFPRSDATNIGDTNMTLSVKPDHKVKTPKKISFADQAQVCVYMVSPRQLDARDDASVDLVPRRLDAGFEDGLGANDKAQPSNDVVDGSDGLAAEATKVFAAQNDSPKTNDDATRHPGEDDHENDTLTLTAEDVEAMRRRLVEVAAQNGVDDDQLATLFELGKTFRGMTFHHVW